MDRFYRIFELLIMVPIMLLIEFTSVWSILLVDHCFHPLCSDAFFYNKRFGGSFELVVYYVLGLKLIRGR